MAKGSTGASMGGTIEYTRMKQKKKKPEAWERPPKKRGLCPKCGYYYQETCTFDGAKNPDKAQCENFAPLHKGKKTAADRKKERKEAEKNKLVPLPCDCLRCVNHRPKTGCRFHLQDKIKDGKCIRFGTAATSGYTTTKEERKEIKAHNKAVDEKREAAKKAPIPYAKLATLNQVCGTNFTMDALRRYKTRGRPGNARYEIQCINEEPLTIKMKGFKGARKAYIIEE